jgi:hypothetical protein
MQMILLLHILAGGLGARVRLCRAYAAKGATLHRKSGMLFVSVMLTRVGARRTFRGIVHVSTPEVTALAASGSASHRAL